MIDRDGGSRREAPNEPPTGSVVEPGAMKEGRPELDEAVETWSEMRDSSMLRGVAAVILGFIALTFGTVLSDRLVMSLTGIGPGDPLSTSFLAGDLGATFVVAILAGWLTARAAPRAPRVHAGVLAAVLIFFSVAAISGFRASGTVVDPSWYPIATLFVGPVGVVIGGALRGGG